MASQQQQVYVQQPTAMQSVWSKMGLGAVMGTCVGLTIGFIGGGFQILRAGPGPRGAMATLAQYMLSSGATFGFFMSIGSVIRSESRDDARWIAAYRAAGKRVTVQQSS
ncbi:subunit of TIM23 translocase complex [Malassezia cuniculi]|uniref:Subunit of TIM23 translocase complex n=1 Tax=Malassezia cuniculi TaxID=948313 RepID=A0AAF0J8D7_9BASI|nr:subunit of TIM23 translocase complex [Malassezia cuniculi]